MKTLVTISRLLSNDITCRLSSVFQLHLSTISTMEACGSVSKTESERDITNTLNKPETTLSKRAQKKQKRLFAKERRKEFKKLNKGLTKNQDPGFDNSLFTDTEYYFENGLRKVYPYFFTFSTFSKQRWVGMTILDVFIKDFHGTEIEEYLDAIECGRVKINGKNVTKDYIIKDNEYLQHTLHRHENPVDGKPLQIIADDDDVVVINKPASIPCHPCGRYRFNSISFILGKEYGYPNLRNLYRLDRLTSGVLIMGKTAESTRKFEDHIARRQVEKEYVCRVVGEFPEEEIICDQPLDVIDHKITLYKVSPKGKECKTKFKRLSFNGTSSVVKCFPFTGRTHQIRVHLQYLGHPIINDPLYNSPAFGPNRGKGGEFWKPEKEMLNEIKNLHNIGLWYEGENPLYHKRLKEIKENKSNTCQAEDTNTFEENMGTSEESNSLVPCFEPPDAKKMKLDSNEKLHGLKLESNEKLQGPDEKIESKTENQESTLSKTVENPCKNDRSVICDNENRLDEEPAKNSTCDKTSSKGINKFDNIQYKPFDESKWIPDEKCSSCKRNYIEPTPSHLVMFLHALRYKGPDWEYSTELPEWAKDDWVDTLSEKDSKT